ncbi:MAG: hypothetical protein ACQEQL_00385 [Pseudomonadota bacterium]
MVDENFAVTDLKRDIIDRYKDEYIARPENDPKSLKGLIRKGFRRLKPVIDRASENLTGNSFVKKTGTLAAVSAVSLTATGLVMGAIGGGMYLGAILATAVAGKMVAGVAAVAIGVGAPVSLWKFGNALSKPPKYEGSTAQKMLEADIENGSLVNRYLREVMEPEMNKFARSNQQKLAGIRSLSKDFATVNTANQLARGCDLIKQTKISAPKQNR